VSANNRSQKRQLNHDLTKGQEAMLPINSQLVNFYPTTITVFDQLFGLSSSEQRLPSAFKLHLGILSAGGHFSPVWTLIAFSIGHLALGDRVLSGGASLWSR